MTIEERNTRSQDFAVDWARPDYGRPEASTERGLRQLKAEIDGIRGQLLAQGRLFDEMETYRAGIDDALDAVYGRIRRLLSPDSRLL